MKKLILAAVGTVAVVILGVVTAAMTSSPDYHVERSVTISSSPEEVFATLTDFRRFVEWSPWDKLDPEMNKEFSGALAGEGAVYHWSGNQDVGEGRMTIVRAQADREVEVRLEFIRPFESQCQTAWTITPGEEGGCTVTWSMDGRNEGVVPRVFGLFMDMDKMVGTDFEKGLQALKSLSEKA